MLHVEFSGDHDAAHRNIVAPFTVAVAIATSALQLAPPRVDRIRPLVELGELVSRPQGFLAVSGL